MSGRVPPIGTLSDRVQLQRKDMSAEPDGGHLTVYVPLATVWARVFALAGHADRSGDARGAGTSHTVVMRFRNDLNPGDRIVYRGRPLEILSANDLNGRRAYLSCACTDQRVSA